MRLPQSPIDIEEFEGLQTAFSNGLATCTTTGTTISTGLMDSSRSPCCGYSVGLKMINNLIVTVDYASPPLETDTHTAIMTTLTTSYKFIPSPGGTPVSIPDATTPINVIIQPGSTAAFVANVLSNATGLANQEGTLIVNVAFSGELQDGTAIAASPMQFPIDVCSGCAPVSCLTGDSVASCTVDSADQPDGTTCVAPLM